MKNLIVYSAFCAALGVTVGAAAVILIDRNKPHVIKTEHGYAYSHVEYPIACTQGLRMSVLPEPDKKLTLLLFCLPVEPEIPSVIPKNPTDPNLEEQ